MTTDIQTESTDTEPDTWDVFRSAVDYRNKCQRDYEDAAEKARQAWDAKDAAFKSLTTAEQACRKIMEGLE